MGVELRLFGGNDCLLIEQRDDEDLYYCTLLVGMRRFYLGSDVAPFLFLRLLAAMTGNLDSPIWTLNGIPVRSALLLPEGHSTLYVGKDARHTLLFWEDEDGQLTATLKLTPADVKQWQRDLETIIAAQQMELPD